jgi:hypothetical protein
MGMAGAFFHVADVALDVFVCVMMSDPMEPHLGAAARAADVIAMDDAADTFVKCRAAFGAAHPDLQIIDGVVHGPAPVTDSAED